MPKETRRHKGREDDSDEFYSELSKEEGDAKAYAEKYQRVVKKIYETKGPYAAVAFQVRYQLGTLGKQINHVGKQIGDLLAGMTPGGDKPETSSQEYVKNENQRKGNYFGEREISPKIKKDKEKPLYDNPSMIGKRRREERARNLIEHRQSRQKAVLSHKSFGGLENATATATIVSFMISLFFFYGNITGNVVGSNPLSHNIFGIVFFLLGLVGVLFIIEKSK